ncbi:outer membrane protein assembly factor BamE [Kushneria aurantia]|uniref:Outer membrane protein assembly factor BamE n=1 Tax=Kushneria aurantia TaxID=504092 RepID=A0ABV6G646_9GAMM|nr:outer membrane protein assembly factor BamE [Kushneria aurantia]
MQNTFKLIIFSFMLSLLAACVYKRDLTQGNLITEDMVSQLQPGMSRQQVVGVMGSPLLRDAFDAANWDYVYWHEAADGDITEKQVSLTFRGDRLSNIATQGNIEAQVEGSDGAAPSSAGARAMPPPGFEDNNFEPIGE